MSENETPEIPVETVSNEDTVKTVEPSKDELADAELASLKARADTIGLKYHPKIGLEKLKARVNEQLAKEPEQIKAEVDQIPDVPQTETYAFGPAESKKETPAKRRMRKHRELSRLVRIRMTCMNPVKKGWHGEIFTVSNSTAGTFKKFIPFNVDNGWHVPNMMIEALRERKFVEHYIAGKDSRGRPIKRHRLVKEFAIEILPPLTAAEIDELKTQQALAGTIGKE